MLNMDVKHTPGPWTEVPQNGSGPMIARSYATGNLLIPTGLRFVCHVLQRGTSFDEDKANACLIAAAPDLLKALETLLGLHDHRVYTADAWNVSMEEARAAIFKAIGYTSRPF